MPAEIVFDQSLGDLFVVRTAGLVLEPAGLGSLEYAVAHLHVPLLVIKGHEACGAVTAAVHHPDLNAGHITQVVQKIAPAAARDRERGLAGPELVETATNLHLALLHDTLRRDSRIIGEALAANRLEITGVNGDVVGASNELTRALVRAAMVVIPVSTLYFSVWGVNLFPDVERSGSPHEGGCHHRAGSGILYHTNADSCRRDLLQSAEGNC